MANEQGEPRVQKKPRKRWDAYRHIAVWLGFLMPIAVLGYPLAAGEQMFAGESSSRSVGLTVAFLVYPALLSGAASGSRFFAVYAGYAERDLPWDPLTPEDAAKGSDAASSPIGDWLWGSLIAGLSGGVVIAAQVAPTQEHDPLGAAIFGILIYLPVAFTVGMGWMLGALIGTGISVLLSTTLGVLFGLKRRTDRRGTLTWVLIGVFVLCALVWSASRFVVDLDPAGAGAAARSTYEMASWFAAILFLVLIGVGTPHLIARIRTWWRTRH